MAKPIDILVTGGSGFLGRAIIKSLLEKHPQWRISSMDIVAPSIDQQRLLYRSFLTDVSSRISVQAVFTDYTPDLIVHSAGVIPAREKRYSSRDTDWQFVKSINYEGTRNLVDVAIAAGCWRMVYTSSCTIVADDVEHDYFFVDETVRTGLATLHYGKSKCMAEEYVLSKDHESKGFQACALRPCTILGEGDTAVISVFHDLISKGETGFIVGNGNNIYDFMYISNAVLAHVLAVENLLGPGTASGHSFFVSNQEPVYFWDFLAFIWAQFGHVPSRRFRIPLFLAWVVALILEYITWLTGTASTLHRGSVKDGVRTRYASNAKAIEILGYRPEVSLSEGVRRACQDYKKYLASKNRSEP